MNSFLIDLLSFLARFTNLMYYLEEDRDAEEAGLDVNQEDEPTANYMGSSIEEDNSFHIHDNGQLQSLDTQDSGS